MAVMQFQRRVHVSQSCRTASSSSNDIRSVSISMPRQIGQAKFMIGSQGPGDQAAAVRKLVTGFAGLSA